MDHEVWSQWQNEISFDGKDALGEILEKEIECPGVYYVAAHKKDPFCFFQEYYMVAADTPVISKKAKTYGQTVPGHPELLVYSFDEERGGYKIIEYEIAKYRVENGLPVRGGETLQDIKLFNMEYHPEYFGPYPVPAVTPMGKTLQHRTLENGIYQLKTAQEEQVLAICYPVWSTELSSYAIRYSKQTEADRNQGIESTGGYLFFSMEDSCIPVYELLLTRSEWKKSGSVDASALMNAIWVYHPEYAVSHNMEEQAGSHDLLGLLLRELGDDVEPICSPQNMIALSPGCGTEFLRL